MFRKSALAMALTGALSSANVVALGLGEIDLKSALNQPLKAEVELLSATPAEMQELKVSIGSPQAFASAGIDRPLFLSKLKFDVSRNADGRPVVLISSRDVVREPFLDFLLEISWSKGRLLREYTVLVDPPLTMPAPAPATQAPAQAAAPAAAPATSASSRRVTHTAEYPPVATAPGEYGPTKRNDTLWNIAQSVRPDAGVSVEQTMLGLQRANPEAFVDNNINNLKAGYVLRIPSREEMTRLSRAEARSEARTQYQAWRNARNLAPTEPVDAASVAAAPVAEAPAAQSSLQLVAPEDAAGGTDAEGAASRDDLQRELMMANEALEAERRQGEELTGRLSMLEEQIVNMQRLIQLKDDELARLQAQAGAEPIDPALAGESATAAPAADAMGEAVPGEDAVLGEVPADADAMSEAVPGALVSDTEPMPADGEMPIADDAAASDAVEGEALPAEVAEALAAIDAETDAAAQPQVGVPVPPEDAAPAPGAGVTPALPGVETAPGFVQRLLENPLWLGAGGVVLALLAFFGLRRKRGVETEFQESILQASQDKAAAGSDSEVVAPADTQTSRKSTESSLLSEFAVSDMGSLKNDGEADPLAEADVYLAYGRFRQAEELIKDALAKDAEREDLNLKLLEVFLAGRNQAAFDEHAQGMLARIQDNQDPVWEKVAEMGREMSPDNPMYQSGDSPAGASASARTDEPAAPEADADDPGLDFDLDLSFDAKAKSDADQPDSMEFTPPEFDADALDDMEPGADLPTDSAGPTAAAAQDNSLDFDVEGFDVDAAAEEDEPQGDGQLADLDEVSTKLDLARAYIDMGDPDGAKSILDEVMEEGSEDQKEEARGIMAQMS